MLGVSVDLPLEKNLESLTEKEIVMKIINFKTMFAVAVAGLFFAAILISSQPNSLVIADPKKQGQDHTGKNCERIDSKESSTFGKCESVCKDKEIIKKDVENNRYVCNAARVKVTRPLSEKAPTGDVKAQDDKSNSGGTKATAPAAPKATKSKKN